jgi:hypothetical protein
LGLLPGLLPNALAACGCVTTLSTCQEVAASNVVFIGTVETVEPNLLDAWSPHANRNWMQAPELVALRKDKSESGVAALKARYLKLLPDIPDSEKARILSAGTQEELQAAITWIQSQGTKVRFQVRTMFQHKKDPDSDDGDKEKEDNEKRQPASKTDLLEVWNESGDCGIPFQKGETYLVYAIDDEESDHLGTNICLRTARLSDAGEDLAYLHFFQRGGSESARLEGFVTSEVAQLMPDRFHYSGEVKSPVSNVVVELAYPGGVRYTESDAGGRFVFDGLAEKEYQLSVFEPGFPQHVHRLSGPKPVRLTTKECTIATLLVLNFPSKKP